MKIQHNKHEEISYVNKTDEDSLYFLWSDTIKNIVVLFSAL